MKINMLHAGGGYRTSLNSVLINTAFSFVKEVQ